VVLLVILGVDPGSVITGYGVVDHANRKNRLVRCGCIQTDPKRPFQNRLIEIYDRLQEVISDIAPDEVALESAFYGANVKTLMKMCHARGVIMLALANSALPIFEYSPREVKKAVVGNGGASKEQVQYMVKSLFGSELGSEKLDVSDAIAIALCHANRGTLHGLGKDTSGQGVAARIEQLKASSDGPKRLKQKLQALGVDSPLVDLKSQGRRGPRR
jgi:crossover junction endodeoxyribonuclease RuvC